MVELRKKQTRANLARKLVWEIPEMKEEAVENG
jgi:hypothetical protein